MSAREEPELERLARLLDECTRQEARDVAAAEAMPDPPDRGSLEARMDTLWEGLDRRRRRGQRLRGLALLAAAAAIVLLVVLRWPSGPKHGTGGELLGTEPAEILSPRPGERSWDGLIAWRGPGGPYVLRVRSAATDEVLLGPLRVAQERYLTSDEERAGWPAEVVIEVEWRRPDGTPERTSVQVTLGR